MKTSYNQWSNNKAEMARVAAMLLEAGKRHEAELRAGKPLDLTLRKIRRSTF